MGQRLGGRKGRRSSRRLSDKRNASSKNEEWDKEIRGCPVAKSPTSLMFRPRVLMCLTLSGPRHNSIAIKRRQVRYYKPSTLWTDRSDRSRSRSLLTDRSDRSRSRSLRTDRSDRSRSRSSRSYSCRYERLCRICML